MGLTTQDGKVLTTKDAERDQENFRREVNGRQVLPDPPWLVEMRKRRVHVINVGPWEHTVWAGSYGSFTIPACSRANIEKFKENPHSVPFIREAHGEFYAEMLMWDASDQTWKPPICSQQFENIIDNEEAMRLDRGQDGWGFAREILGEGRGQNMAFSLRHRGCSEITGQKPTQDELIGCRLELEEDCRRLVAEARELWASNEPMARQGIVKGRHDVAAEILNLSDEPWIIARNPEGRLKCRFCGTFADAGTLKCPTVGCPGIFDPVAYAAALKDQEQQMRQLKEK